MANAGALYSDSVSTGDWITLVLAFATAIMAAATVWLGVWARKEAIATARLGDEAKRDRELAVQPRLSALWPTSVPFTLSRDHPITLVNAGTGPALGVRYLGRPEDGTGLVSVALDLAATERKDVRAINPVKPEVAERLVSWRAASGGEGQVTAVIVCTDVLGVRYRFLLTGDAFGLPVVIRAERWRAEEPTQPWAQDDPAIWPFD